MAKLYTSLESKQHDTPTPEEENDGLDGLPEMDDEEEELDMALEASNMAVERFNCLTGISAHLGSQKLCSEAYMASMEGYSPLIKELGARLGLKTLPSLEDYKNPYAAKTSHTYTMEGIKEILSKAWEKIKDFFRSFFKKIALFFKRIAGAELDFEEYEKYCDKLVAKLVLHKATISDTTPMPSKLPALLAGDSGTPVDSDYILSTGLKKVQNLFDVVKDISIEGTNGAHVIKGLTDMSTKISSIISVGKHGFEDIPFLQESIVIVKSVAMDIVQNVFKNNVTGFSDVPRDVHSKLREKYSDKNFDANDVLTYSVAKVGDPYSELPRKTNMYFVKHGDDFLVVPSDKDEISTVEGRLKPIGNLDNLSKLHKDYKNTFGKLNLKGLDKNAERVASEVDKIMAMLKRDFTGIVDRVATASVSNPRKKLLGMILEVCDPKRNPKITGDADDIIKAGVDNTGNLTTDEQMDNLRHIANGLIEDYSKSLVTESTLKERASQISKAIDVMSSEAVDAFIAGMVSVEDSFAQDSVIARSAEDIALLRGMLTEFNSYLVRFFQTLQGLYKGLMTDFYSVLVEVRKALIMYIYDSAKRYSY